MKVKPFMPLFIKKGDEGKSIGRLLEKKYNVWNTDKPNTPGYYMCNFFDGCEHGTGVGFYDGMHWKTVPDFSLITCLVAYYDARYVFTTILVRSEDTASIDTLIKNLRRFENIGPNTVRVIFSDERMKTYSASEEMFETILKSDLYDEMCIN